MDEGEIKYAGAITPVVDALTAQGEALSAAVAARDKSRAEEFSRLAIQGTWARSTANPPPSMNRANEAIGMCFALLGGAATSIKVGKFEEAEGTLKLWRWEVAQLRDLLAPAIKAFSAAYPDLASNEVRKASQYSKSIGLSPEDRVAHRMRLWASVIPATSLAVMGVGLVGGKVTAGNLAGGHIVALILLAIAWFAPKFLLNPYFRIWFGLGSVYAGLMACLALGAMFA